MKPLDYELMQYKEIDDQFREQVVINRMLYVLLIAATLMIACLIIAPPACASSVFSSKVFAKQNTSGKTVNLNKIKQIESSGNPFAFNKRSKARGLYQITPICLKEWNNFHPNKQYSKQDLFNPVINKQIAQWYLNKRIPQMLKYYGHEVNIRNVLVSYNAGISYVVNNKPLPKETKNYLIKYERN